MIHGRIHPDGRIGVIGGIGNLAFIIVLAVFYLWRKHVLTKQMDELLKTFTQQDKEELLREVVG